MTECKVSYGEIETPPGPVEVGSPAPPGKLIICIWECMGIEGSIGAGRFMKATEAAVVGEKEISATSLYMKEDEAAISVSRESKFVHQQSLL